jgi:uncharacterized caspase-like protein
MRMTAWGLLCLLLSTVLGLQAAEPARIALVIGNSHYQGQTWAPLRNPGNDAQTIAKALRTLQFQLVGCGDDGICLDSTLTSMKNATRAFLQTLRDHRGAIAFVYFSGHGVRTQRTPSDAYENFLIPVNSGIQDDFEVPHNAISETELLDEIKAVGAEAIVVVDACRDNALMTKSPRKGLEPTGAPGFLVAYAAAAGQGALDTGAYARRLAEQLLTPKSIVEVFLDVREQVVDDTHGLQQPEALMALNRNLYLAGRAAAEVRPRAVAAASSTATPVPAVAPAGPSSSWLKSAGARASWALSAVRGFASSFLRQPWGKPTIVSVLFVVLLIPAALSGEISDLSGPLLGFVPGAATFAALPWITGFVGTSTLAVVLEEVLRAVAGAGFGLVLAVTIHDLGHWWPRTIACLIGLALLAAAVWL